MIDRYSGYVLRLATGVVLTLALAGISCDEDQKKQGAGAPQKREAVKKEQTKPPAPEKNTQAKTSEKPAPSAAKLGSERNLDLWTSQLTSADRDFRSFAAISLLRWGDKATLDMLTGMLTSNTTSDDVRLTIIKAFQFESNPAAVEQLLLLLSDPNADIRSASVEALGALRSPEAIKRMSSLLADNTKPTPIRVEVAESLGMTKDKDAIGPLVDTLSENDKELRKAASASLIEITRQKDLGDDPVKWREWWDRNKHKSREELLDMALRIVEGQLKNAQSTLNGLSDLLAQATIDKLNNRPDKSDPTLLIQETKNINPKVRCFVAQELANIKSDTAFNALKAMTADKSEDVRTAVVKALGDSGDKRACDDLIHVLNTDPDPRVRAEAAGSLRKLPTSKSVSPLLAALDNPNVAVASEAANALGELGDVRAVPPLIAILCDPKRPSSTREAAAGALGTLADRRAVEPLIATLGDEYDRLRWWAAMALGKLADRAAVKPLCHTVVFDPVPSVRVSAAMSLGALRDKEAIDPLAKAVNDQDPKVADAAREALFAIAGEDCDMLLHVGQILLVKPEYAAAARIFEKVVQAFADKPEYSDQVWRAKDSLAQCYAKLGEWKKARPLYEELVNHESARSDLRQALVRAMVQNKEFTAAARFILESLSQSPDQAQTWWEELHKMLDQNFSQIGASGVLQIIVEAEQHGDSSLGGEALRESFERLKAKAQRVK